jgi:hypothetical protein
MRRFVLLLALVCAMFSVTAKADVPRHNFARTRAHNATLRSTHSAAAGRRAPAHAKAGKRRIAVTSHARHVASAHANTRCRRGRHCAAPQHAVLSPHYKSPKTTLRTQPLEHVKFALPPPMKGSHESLVRQNVRADQEGLSRIEDDGALAEMLGSRQLVSLPTGDGLTVDPRLPPNRRYCRSWTASFLTDMSRAHYSRFRTPLQVNSAVRTVKYQRHLRGINGNAAPAEGDIASPHLTGATIDIGKKGLSMAQIGWMRAYLLPLQSRGRIDVEEEFQQACFHITVYKTYSPGPEPSPATPGHVGAMVATDFR